MQLARAVFELRAMCAPRRPMCSLAQALHALAEAACAGKRNFADLEARA